MSGFAVDPEDEAATLVGLLDGLLDRGVHVAGDLVIGLADVELVRVALRLLVASEDTAQRTGLDPPGPGVTPSMDAPGPPPADPGPAADASPPTRVGHATPSFRRAVGPPSAGRAPTEDDEQRLADGVARLVLTVVAVIHDLVERQAIRRVEAGTLDDDQVERLGVALQALEERMAEVREVFGVADEDLDLDLGPLGRLR